MESYHHQYQCCGTQNVFFHPFIRSVRILYYNEYNDNQSDYPDICCDWGTLPEQYGTGFGNPFNQWDYRDVEPRDDNHDHCRDYFL